MTSHDLEKVKIISDNGCGPPLDLVLHDCTWRTPQADSTAKKPQRTQKQNGGRSSAKMFHRCWLHNINTHERWEAKKQYCFHQFCLPMFMNHDMSLKMPFHIWLVWLLWSKTHLSVGDCRTWFTWRMQTQCTARICWRTAIMHTL